MAFKEKLKTEFEEILKTRRATVTRSEEIIQKFFERNPSALIAVLDGVQSSYQIFGKVVISQPKLKSLGGDKQPDFLIVTWDSLNLYFNFIEIEDPSKDMFYKNKLQLSSDFIQAFNQLKQWQVIEDSVKDYCKELLTSLFHNNFNNTGDKELHYNYILLYGFSDEIDKYSPAHNKLLQSYFREPSFFHCTYSRILRNLRLETPLFTVRKDALSGKFNAIGFQPFKRYGVSDWSELHNVKEKQELIAKSDLLSEEEKKNLISQINDLDKKSLSEIYKISETSLGSTLEDSLDLLD